MNQFKNQGNTTATLTTTEGEVTQTQATLTTTEGEVTHTQHNREATLTQYFGCNNSDVPLFGILMYLYSEVRQQLKSQEESRFL